jgi:ATP-dependent exoDNAse (exonuclease V) alpha subunit
VIVNVDSVRGGQLVNRKQFYVSISRARQDARVYTDDSKALRRVVARDHNKEVALEVVNTRPTQRLQPKSPTQELQQGRATGISIHR